MKKDMNEELLHEVKAISGFKAHVSIYIVIVGLLWIIWLIKGGLDIHPWPVYPTVAWGIGLFFHYMSAYGIYRKVEKEQDELT
ncbi:MAG TPA: 2TM domain-containing protein [Chitinophagaceae bacterium]|nr:2TM domain-containing protein [Chitinophagaceae bacterium]